MGTNGSILALDLGAKTGWAISSQLSTTSGTIQFTNGRHEGGGMRFVLFQSWLQKTMAAANVERVFYEEVRRHLGVDAAHAYGGYLAILTAVCENMQIPYLGVPVGTIKKFATGKGNASKEEVMFGVRRMGFFPKDDNESDAIALMQYALRLVRSTV